MSLNLLITPNVIINCLLLFEQKHQNLAYINCLNRIINLSEENNFSLFMTEMDFKIVNYYYESFKLLLRELSVNISEIEKTLKLLETLQSVKKYLNYAQAYSIDRDILNLATYFSINNPSDAVRFATAVAGEQLKKPIKIDAIITWEPSHFCQNTDDFFSVRKSGYGQITATINDYYDYINQSKRKIEIQKNIYAPNQFFFSRYIPNNIDYPRFFRLINIDFKTNINQENQTSIVRVTVDYNNEDSYIYEYCSRSGATSTLFVAIYVCVKKICLKKKILNKKLINTKLIRDIIFSVTPVKGNNREIYADILISDKDTQSSKRGTNLLWSAGEAYIDILNLVINKGTEY